jgi:hypothetical protein
VAFETDSYEKGWLLSINFLNVINASIKSKIKLNQFSSGNQGCQIFLGTIYQHGEKYTCYHQIYQMAMKYRHKMSVK